jgi:hypothetical protein
MVSSSFCLTVRYLVFSFVIGSASQTLATSEVIHRHRRTLQCMVYATHVCVLVCLLSPCGRKLDIFISVLSSIGFLVCCPKKFSLCLVFIPWPHHLRPTSEVFVHVDTVMTGNPTTGGEYTRSEYTRSVPYYNTALPLIWLVHQFFQFFSFLTCVSPRKAINSQKHFGSFSVLFLAEVLHPLSCGCLTCNDLLCVLSLLYVAVA